MKTLASLTRTQTSFLHDSPNRRGRKTFQPSDIQALLKQLDDVDISLLQWLLHYPFQRAEDLVVAWLKPDGMSTATVYRHLLVQQQWGLIESVTPGTLSSGASALYHLSNLGLHLIAAHEHTDPLLLARRWKTDERGLLHLLPRLARLMTIQQVINGLVLDASTALASSGHASSVHWHWVRDYRHHFHYREQESQLAVDAALFLHVRPPGSSSCDERAEAQRYMLFLLLDTPLGDGQRIRQRLGRILHYRESAERWSVYPHFPPVMVLTSSLHRIEQWRRHIGEVTTALRVAPPTGVIAYLPPGSDAPRSSPWHLPWKSLATNAPCHVQEVLTPLPMHALLPPFVEYDAPSAFPTVQTAAPVVPSTTPTGPLAPTPARLSRIIRGNFTERSKKWSNASVSSQNDQDEWETLALLGIRIGRRHVEVLTYLFDHPLLSREELALLLDLQTSTITRYLSEVRRYGCIEPIATRVGPRWRLSVQGMRLLAAMQQVSLKSIATMTTPISEQEEPKLVQRGQEVLLRQVEHTAGVYSFFALLSQTAQQERMQGMQHRLLWWESGRACMRRYRYADSWHNLRPDASGEYAIGEQRLRFWLEWDNGTMNVRDLAVKFSTYAHYVASHEWAKERAILPYLLIVAPERAQEMRIERVAKALLANTPGLFVRITTATRLREKGPLAAIWLPGDQRYEPDQKTQQGMQPIQTRLSLVEKGDITKD